MKPTFGFLSPTMPAVDAGNNRADCSKEIFQGLFDDGFRNRRGRSEGAAIDVII